MEPRNEPVVVTSGEAAPGGTRRGGRGRWALYSLNMFIVVVAVLAIVVLANAVSWNHYARPDITSRRILSISEKTRSVIREQLTEALQVTVVMRANAVLHEYVTDLLKQYSAVAPDRVTVETVDPYQDRAKGETVIQLYNITAIPAVVFKYGEREKTVGETELVEYEMEEGGSPFGGASRRVKEFKAEGAFTAAIVELTKGEKKTVYFLQGHGEKRIDDFEPGKGYTEFAEALKRDYLDPQSLTLAEAGAIPEDAALIVLAGPRSAIPREEVERLRLWLDGGGRLLALLDPLIEKGGQGFRPVGVEAFLREHGAEVGDDVVLDPPRSQLEALFQDPRQVNVLHFGDHPIVKPFDTMQAVLPLARSVGPIASASHRATMLMESRETGWAETEIADPRPDEEDRKGPIPLAVAVERGSLAEGPAGGEEKRPWRLVVVGDSDFLVNSFINEAGVNKDLGLAMVNWLVERAELIGISPKAPENVRLSLSPEQMNQVFLLILVGLPLFWVALGGGVWWLRRR